MHDARAPDASTDTARPDDARSDDARKAQAPRKGRGAASFVAGEDATPPGLDTHVTEERARSIVSRNSSPDVGFSQSINPYRGCEHGCVYCFARPSHAYLDLSPGLDFETKLYAKTNAAERLRHELAKPGYVPEPIGW